MKIKNYTGEKLDYDRLNWNIRNPTHGYEILLVTFILPFAFEPFSREWPGFWIGAFFWWCIGCVIFDWIKETMEDNIDNPDADKWLSRAFYAVGTAFILFGLWLMFWRFSCTLLLGAFGGFAWILPTYLYRSERQRKMASQASQEEMVW